mmetsp:Transcript_66812/g.134161  ORF Transcript_66812/g.134161 Transcript_66812/m.134161 type:complete len:111 (-) Transcript_66812:98-430(-)
MGREIAHFIKSCGRGSGKSHTFQSKYGDRTVRDDADGFIYLTWGDMRPVSENCPKGWHHMQWVIATSLEPSPAMDALRPWLQDPATAAEPQKEQKMVAAKEIWTVHRHLL